MGYLLFLFCINVEASEFNDSDLIEVPDVLEGTLVSDKREEATIVEQKYVLVGSWWRNRWMERTN